jgi:hypothetical protein
MPPEKFPIVKNVSLMVNARFGSGSLENQLCKSGSAEIKVKIVFR